MASDVEQIYGNNYITLSENQDLNTVINIGTYVTSTDTLSRTIINRPSEINVKFKLVVSDSIGYHYSDASYKRQRIYAYSSHEIYDRYSNAEGTWSDWAKIS